MRAIPALLTLLLHIPLVCGQTGSPHAEPLFANEVLFVPGLISGVDNSYFTNVELQLNGNGQWQVLAAEKAELIHIESMTLAVLESFPLQVEVLINGILPAPCYSHALHQRRHENTFHLALVAVGPASGIFCAGPTQPFALSLPLDVLGLEAGTYTVRVNDASATFTFDQNNSVP